MFADFCTFPIQSFVGGRVQEMEGERFLDTVYPGFSVTVKYEHIDLFHFALFYQKFPIKGKVY